MVCVNDGATMMAWKKDLGLAGSDLIDFVADTHAQLTDALGLQLTGTVSTGGFDFVKAPAPIYDGPNKARALRPPLPFPRSSRRAHSFAAACAHPSCRASSGARLPHEAVQAHRHPRR